MATISAESTITVDHHAVIREVDRRCLGVNLNYWADDDRNRPAGSPPLIDALRAMGAGLLRFPGGEKSDSHLWSVPPFDRPRPTLIRTGPNDWPSCSRFVMQDDGRTFRINPLDFDAFMTICRTTGAEPILVVCHDAWTTAAEPGGTAPTQQELIDAAAAWVRYANLVRGYGVKRWEIGNESYLDNNGGWCTAAMYGDSLARFATAMKAVDPTISIGACGPNDGGPGRRDRAEGRADPWWQTVFAHADKHIDFISIHTYPCWEWKTYEFYRTQKPDLMGDVNRAIAVVESVAPANRRDVLEYVITEYNAADWSAVFGAKDGWPMRNDLGHALVDVDLIGTWLCHPRLSGAALWNTRYPHEKSEPNQVWDALDDANGLRPTGMALALWQRVLGTRMVRVAVDGAETLRAYASLHEDGSLGMVLINKDHKPARMRLGGVPLTSVNTWCLTGSGPDDLAPTLNRITGAAWLAELPPWSATALLIKPQ